MIPLLIYIVTNIVFSEVKPNETSITLTPNPPIFGRPVILMCKSKGFPEPSYTIWHNGSDVVSNEKMYVIPKANWNDSGSYRCVVENKLGSDSESYFLTIVGEISIKNVCRQLVNCVMC